MVRERSIDSFYAALRSAALACPSSPLLIFPSAADADSLCALRLATHILSSDSVHYSVYPVSSFADLTRLLGPNRLSSEAADACVVLLLNWGSHRDLRRALALGPGVRVFVVDSHRPVHLHNLSDLNDRVVVLYTLEDEVQADRAYGFDVSALASCSDLSSDDELDLDRESDDSSESEVEDADLAGEGKRRRVAEELESGADPIRIYRKQKAAYYKLGTFHGRPSGGLLYGLAHSLSLDTNELLWLACVSLTDHLVHERLTDQDYAAAVLELQQCIVESGNLSTVSVVTLKDGTKIQAPENLRIHCEDEPRLMLLREWTLLDSMLCSPYTATKLKTWSDNGAKKVQFLLARMGFPLADCRKKFQYMSLEVKQKMRSEFERLLPEYGLDKFYYSSFLRSHGYGPKVSAADVVYGVTALLESIVDDGSPAAERFWDAYSALSADNLDGLKKGMQKAVEIQRAILRQVSSAITKSGFVRSGRKFRWVKLEDPADTKLLGRPQALTKFCFFMMDALRERGAKMKPLVCACLLTEPAKVLVVGVCGRPLLGKVRGNAFGLAFRAAAEEIGKEYFHELFESSWIILDTVAVSSFMVRLTEKL